MIQTFGSDQPCVNVLLVEDNPGDAELIGDLLAETGATFELSHVSRLSAALEYLGQKSASVVLLDLFLPDSFGLVGLEKIVRAAPMLPVIVLTGLDDEGIADRALQEGAQDYLLKGQIDQRLLMRALRYAIERKRVENSLRYYTLQLEARNEELDGYAHTVAHDIKTPIGLIIGYADLLLEDNTLSEAERQDYLRIIVRTSYKMTSIVNEILLLAGVRKTQPDVMPLNMAEVVDTVLLRLAAEIKNANAEIVLPSEFLQGVGYGPWLEEVWANYISNACKYGGQPPRVELGTTAQNDGTVRFWVKDNGLGLTSEQQAAIFRPFTRLEQVRVEGTGLGLSIVARIMEKLGGKAGVESEGIGQGSTFFFTLPGLAGRVLPDAENARN